VRPVRKELLAPLEHKVSLAIRVQMEPQDRKASQDQMEPLARLATMEPPAPWGLKGPLVTTVLSEQLDRKASPA
jgi:hypothetical protein